MSKSRSRVRLAAIWGSVVVVALAVVAAGAAQLTNMIATANVVPTASPTNADQRAVVATVDAFRDAWLEQDCEAYLAITTQREQEEAGITDCASFEERSNTFSAIVSDAEVVVTDIRGPEYQHTVTTRERFLVQRDPDGFEVQPQHVVVEYSYDVVPHDDHWAILWWIDGSPACNYWSPALTTIRGGGCASGGSGSS